MKKKQGSKYREISKKGHTARIRKNVEELFVRVVADIVARIIVGTTAALGFLFFVGNEAYFRMGLTAVQIFAVAGGIGLVCGLTGLRRGPGII